MAATHPKAARGMEYRMRDQDDRQAQRRDKERGTLQELEADAGKAEGLALRAYHKFANDWTMNLVAMVSYNVLTSFFPVVLAVITILALVPSITGNTHALAAQINQILPAEVSKQLNIDSLISAVNARAGLLTIISIITLLWGGSNLFGSIESAFAVIFRVKTRAFVAQKLMSVTMILLFVVLLPLSFISSFFISAASSTLGKIIPGALNGPFALILSLATSLAALFVLFAAIYTVVPNIPVRWRYAWRGALVAAVAMWAINTIFPFYTSHFVGTKQYGAAALGSAIITIIWFWFFALVLLIGAQINALLMGIGPWKYDLPRVLMESRIPTTSGSPTAMAALEAARDPAVTNAPVGLARDSQEVEDPAKHQQRRPHEDSDDRDQGGLPGTPSDTKAVSANSAGVASKGDAHPKAHTLHAWHRDKDEGASQHPHPAHDMDPGLVAAGIAPGGVQMATADETLGAESVRKGAIAVGAALGLLGGLKELRQHHK